MAYSPSPYDVTASISIAANSTSSGSCVTQTGGSATYTFQLTGTWTGTVQVQLTRDGTNWVNVTGSTMVVNAATGAYLTSGSITANGLYMVNATGFAGARIITTAYTLGPITGSAVLAISEGVVAVQGSINVVSTSTTPVSPSTHTSVSTASTNAVSIKATAGSVYSIVLSNVSASQIFYKIYNKASAPTVGTDVPIATFPVPAGATISYEFGATGFRCSTGIAAAATAAAAATDTNISAAGMQIVLAYL